ncbi:MAG: hypothetical protein L3J79_09570 [Candidatus Marinimicrobia bacterium]|nr:hypothetical protein [Candidatus Neomarinimicrobiota bacterium]
MRSLLLSCLTAVLAFGEWSPDPAHSLDLGTGMMPEIAASSDGGLYVAWLTEGDFHIYLQRLNAAGTPQWTPGGRLISAQPNNSWIAIFHLNLVTDSDGNAIITSVDTRSGNWEIYAYKIGPDGNQLWGENGVTLSSTGGDNIGPRMTLVPDDNSVIVTWSQDYSSLRLQRISPEGGLLWGANGISLSDLGGDYISPQPIMTSAGSVIVQWIRQTGNFPALSSQVLVRQYDLNGSALWPVISMNPAIGFPMGNWTQNCLPVPAYGNYSSWTELAGNNQTGKVNHLDGSGSLSWAAPIEVSLESTHFRVSPQLAAATGSQAVYAVWNETDASQVDRGI